MIGIDVPAWMAAAACADGNTELFFPVGSSAAAQRQVAAAKEVCAGCPVRFECLDHALERREPYGVWGGFDEDERGWLRRRLLRADPPDPSPPPRLICEDCGRRCLTVGELVDHIAIDHIEAQQRHARRLATSVLTLVGDQP